MKTAVSPTAHRPVAVYDSYAEAQRAVDHLSDLLGAVLHFATGGTRDFTSVPGFRAERYEIVVDEDVAERAEAALSDQQ